MLVPDPAHAEVHLLHPGRHDGGTEAEHVLGTCLFSSAAAAGGPVTDTVPIRDDPCEAVEAVLTDEPVDDITSLATSGLSRALHLDLPPRLAHFGLPVHVVDQPLPVAAG